MLGGEGDRGDQRFPRLGRWNFGWGPPDLEASLAAAVLTLAANFFSDFPAARLWAAVELVSCF